MKHGRFSTKIFARHQCGEKALVPNVAVLNIAEHGLIVVKEGIAGLSKPSGKDIQRLKNDGSSAP